MRWKLKACRVQAGLSQKEAARLIGVSETSIINYETGKTAVSMDVAQRMSDVYGIPHELMEFSKIGNTVINNK